MENENLDFSSMDSPSKRYYVEVSHGHADFASWYAVPNLASDDLDAAIAAAKTLMEGSSDGWNERARVTDINDNVLWP